MQNFLRARNVLGCFYLPIMETIGLRSITVLILSDDTEWNYSVTVEVREINVGSKTDPIQMVKEAKKNKVNYAEVWVVFDKDRERDALNQKAIALATKSKIKIAFSSISFEHWLILHFEKCLYSFEKMIAKAEAHGLIQLFAHVMGLFVL